MGERDTVWPKPGYNGLCNYAQKITSCFGLDGKTGVKWRGCVCGAGCRNNSDCEMFGMYFVCDAHFAVCEASKSCLPERACVDLRVCG